MNLKFCTDIPLIMYFPKIQKKFNETVIFCWHQHNFLYFSQFYRTGSNVSTMRTKAYFSILLTLNVRKMVYIFEKIRGSRILLRKPGFFTSGTSGSSGCRKNPGNPEKSENSGIYHILLLGWTIVPNLKSNQWLVQKLWPNHFVRIWPGIFENLMGGFS